MPCLQAVRGACDGGRTPLLARHSRREPGKFPQGKPRHDHDRGPKCPTEVRQQSMACAVPSQRISQRTQPFWCNQPRLTTAVSQCSLPARRGCGRSGGFMFGLGDLFQWERFVTPTVIKVFYWLAVVISVLLGFAGVVSSLTTMAYNPFVGLIFLITSVLGTVMGIVMSRIAAEFVLIVFRINEHLGAIRNQGGFRNQ